jgi:hypothetical protein
VYIHRRYRFAALNFIIFLRVVGNGGTHHAFVGEFDAPRVLTRFIGNHDQHLYFCI